MTSGISDIGKSYQDVVNGIQDNLSKETGQINGSLTGPDVGATAASATGAAAQQGQEATATAAQDNANQASPPSSDGFAPGATA